MKEIDLMMYCWKHMLFKGIVTDKGDEVSVSDIGLFHRRSGNMFYNAKLSVGRGLELGCVLFLEKSSDWYIKPHELVRPTLVVCCKHDSYLKDVNGEDILCACPEIPVIVRCRVEALMSSSGMDLCMRFNGDEENTSRLIWRSWKSVLTTEELEVLSSRAESVYRDTQSWDMTLFVMTSRVFGMRPNVFGNDTHENLYERWALSIPESLAGRYSDDLFMLESLFLGKAGMLSSQAVDGKFRDCAEKEGYYTRMRDEYEFMLRKYALNNAVACSDWKSEKVPFVKIARLANMWYNGVFMMHRLKNVSDIKGA